MLLHEALAFVPMSISGLTAVRPDDAGIASGLINTPQKIGGAIDVTVATMYANHVVDSHPAPPPPAAPN